MQIIDGRYVYSASDLNNFLECRHLSELDRKVAKGALVRPERDESVELIARKGLDHEKVHLGRLKANYGESLVEFTDRAENSDAGLRAAEAVTLAAMESGAEIIYQATFFDGTFLGRADFLRKVPDARTRCGWNYEVLDTKLALSTKPYFLIQLCNYSEHIHGSPASRPSTAISYSAAATRNAIASTITQPITGTSRSRSSKTWRRSPDRIRGRFRTASFARGMRPARSNAKTTTTSASSPEFVGIRSRNSRR